METLNNNLEANSPSRGFEFNSSIALGIGAAAVLVAGFVMKMIGSISSLDMMAMVVFSIGLAIGAMMVHSRNSEVRQDRNIS